MNRTRLIYPSAILCLLLSGAAGLVYEVVWARYLALFLGHTSYAVISVLVAFMGGLAIGNAWLGTLADRLPRPLAFYAWLEIGIGVYALVFPSYFELCRGAFLSLAQGLPSGSPLMLFLKFAFSLLTILIPTVLMGGTLPVLTRQITRSLSEVRQNVAALYLINSAGAVIGCAVADFWWIPSLGLQATVWAGAALNLFVGAAALLLSGWIGEDLATGPPLDSKPRVQSQETFTQMDLRLAGAAIGLSGFVAMLYEVVWTRLLALALGSSTHAFSLMLITFISGIAIGSGLVYCWKSLRRTLDAFAWAELGLALSLFVSMFFYDRVPYWFMRLAELLVRSPRAYPAYGILQTLICFLVMLVPAIFLGMTLPLASRVATAELARTGRSVGSIFAVNTLGTVLGASVTGLWLMPWLGLARTLGFGLALNTLIGAILLVRNRVMLRNIILWSSPLFVVGLTFLAGLWFNRNWQPLLTAGLWRRTTAPPTFSVFRSAEIARTLRYYRDGASATVSVNSWRVGTNEHFNLKINGKPDASSTTDMGTQLLSAHIPLLLHPHSTRALVVGLGSGITCSAALQHPSIERLDVLEISPEVVEAARFFDVHNRQVLDNPRLRLVVEDAKTFLQTTTNTYDAIMSEPSNPWMAGVAGVFTREYYETCAKRLAANGLMVQWVQAYETSNETLEIVLGTFASVFPHLSVWHGAVGDLILLGSLQPIQVDLTALEERFELPGLKADFEEVDLFRLPVFLSHELISQQNGLYVPGLDTVQHSDFYPVLEYVAQKAFFIRKQADIATVFNENVSPRPTTLLAEYLRERPLSESDFKAFTLYYNSQHLPDVAVYRTILERWQHDFPQVDLAVDDPTRATDPSLLAELGSLRMASRRDRMFELAKTDPVPLRLYAKLLLESYRAKRSVFFKSSDAEIRLVLERLAAVDAANRRVHLLHLAEVAWDNNDDIRCLELGRQALDPLESEGGPMNFDADPAAPPRVLRLMIESLWRSDRLPEAAALCQRAGSEGYLGSRARVRDPLLEMTWRKVQSTVSQLSEAN